MDLSETHFSSIVRHPWELARLDVVKKLLIDHRIYGVGNFTFLDVGCGDVFFLNGIKETYPNASLYGIDHAFSPQIMSRIKQEYTDFDGLLVSNFAELPLSDENPAHVVFLLDVIEHVEDDQKFLRDLMKQPFISNETLIIITVPAYQKLFSSHDLILGHFRRYTNTSLRNTLQEAGLIVFDYGYFFTLLILVRVFSLVKEKLFFRKPEKTEAGEWNKGAGVTKSLRIILQYDFFLSRIFRKIGIRLPGLSNYAICQKQA